MSENQRRDFLRNLTGAVLAAPLATALLGQNQLQAAAGKPKIKIGQIGTKHAHASGKMATMRKFNELYEVVGVVEPDARRRETLSNSATYRGVKWMSREQLLNTKGLQAVAVETEVRNLVPTALICVAAGMHVHLDKPAGENLSSFKKVLDAATKQNKIVQMGYMYRYNPAFLFLFEAVSKGWLGDIFEVDTVMSKVVGAATRKKLSEYPGGSMFELGCHVIDAVVHILGKPNKVTPYVRRTLGDDLADNQLAVFEYPKATATVRSALVEIEGGRRRQLVVCGTRGTIDIRPLEPPRLLLALDRPQGKFKKGYQEVRLPKPGGRYDGDFQDLAAVIHGEKEFGYSPAHDLAVQQAILKASGLKVE